MPTVRPGKTIAEVKRRVENTPTEELIEPAKGDPFGEPLSSEEQFQLLEGVGQSRAEEMADTFGTLSDFRSGSTASYDDLDGISKQQAAIFGREINQRGIEDIEQRDDIRGGKRKQAEDLKETATTPFELRDEQTVTPAERIQAGNKHADRKPKAQRVDENRQAPVTGDYEQWAASPGRFDFPGVDSRRNTEDEFADSDGAVSRGEVFTSFVTATREKKQQADDDVVFFAAENLGLPL